MKKFIELKITSKDEQLIINLLDDLKKSKSSKWTFEKKLSSDYAKNIFLPHEKVACFKANATKHYEATIWVIINKQELKITNIVSKKISYLGIDIYNSILKSFYNDFIKPKIKTDKIKTYLSNEELTINELANEATAKKLITWEASCNPSTGISHPYDRERWFDFIITAIETKSQLSPEDLERWLIEEQNWLGDTEDALVYEIVEKYEYSIDLLNYYVGENN